MSLSPISAASCDYRALDQVRGSAVLTAAEGVFQRELWNGEWHGENEQRSFSALKPLNQVTSLKTNEQNVAQ